MLKGIFKLMIALPLMVLMALVVTMNVNINNTSESIISGDDKVDQTLVKELRGLKKALDQHADTDMQHIFPEGYVFFNAIYALTWSSFLEHRANNSFVSEGRAEMHKALLKINSPTGRAPFNDELSLPYGSFYNGWSSYVLGSKLKIEDADIRDKKEMDQFKQQCAAIAKAIQQRTYPVSYYGSAWPADVMVCVASLSLHDKLFTPQYKDVIDHWVTEVRKHVDADGMIPHAVLPADGRAREPARGSSLALMLIFLREIDAPLAREQFALFKEKFIDSWLGLTGVREYPKGVSGMGDIDSGPVIFGFGGAATIVGMQTLSLYGEQDLSASIRGTVEAMAFPWQTADTKKYFFGVIPLADAFIAWSHSGMKTRGAEVSFVRFRIYSVSAFILLSFFFWMLVKSRKS
ncbi:hypothetical protein KK083_09130 [Fulvivirgaceae bacterium PWU4]|uniref:Linalool dehydratase/isomerase domain-containing protein n=1 Tax=Chryseosolibacter histidini TaxID=2782349 RepID=A0AAP2DIX2_9BACT|nr:hypothetical protein [Chryseosolibacter histidini]MBT1697035.1 hypothetical protein [Chryseosolibacter histidini]